MADVNGQESDTGIKLKTDTGFFWCLS